MSPLIVKEITKLKEQIDRDGWDINDTRELAGVLIPPIPVHEMDLISEEDAIRNYYAQLGINLQVIRSLEHNLYEFIYRGLRQSVEQLLYFDKTQNHTSRRFVFSTTDCISFIQMLYRNETARLFAHLRSTDVVKLLPWDLLFLCKLTKRILVESEFPLTKQTIVTVSIASAHYYLSPPTMY